MIKIPTLEPKKHKNVLISVKENYPLGRQGKIRVTIVLLLIIITKIIIIILIIIIFI